MAKFQHGHKGGRPRGARNKLCDAFMKDLVADWLVHGAKTIEVMRKEDPSSYVRTVASLMPKELDAHIDTKFTNFKDWLSWTQDPKLMEAMQPKAIEAQKVPEPLAALSRPEPKPQPGPPVRVAFNASEAARAEPIVEKPRLKLSPPEVE